MKNQDMPANPVSPNKHDPIWAAARDGGETKFEKAFWLIYNSYLSRSELKIKTASDFHNIAFDAVRATKAGFKALENNNDWGWYLRKTFYKGRLLYF